MDAEARQIDVTFPSAGVACAGTLYLPVTGQPPYPLVVMAGGWCYVKEIVMPAHAAEITRRGVACLTFDYRGLGASDGQPRQHLDPWAQIEDYRNALSFAETLPEVDVDRLGVWGISYSGGHVLIVSALDSRVRCAVSVVPVVDGFPTMKRVHGERRFAELGQFLLDDRRKRAADPAAAGVLPMSASDPETTLCTWPFPTVTEVFNRIKEASAPRHEHWSTAASTELLMTYTVFPYVGRILNIPTLMIVAENDNITMWDLEIEAFNQIATPNKELAVLPDTNHMSLYSNKSHLEMAAERGADWLGEHLAKPG